MGSRDDIAGDGPHDASLSRGLTFPELIGFAAAVMALNALAIDMMLPALGIIGDELGAARANDRQLVIVIYVLGNGVAQLFFGPVVDRFGRRPVLMWALGGYMAASLLSVFAGTFAMLLASRALQGVAAAAARVAMIAIVRDTCSGRRMAEVMSLAITIFMAAPVLAPSFGQLVMFAAPWRGIFVALFLYGLILTVWAGWRVTETLAPENRRSLKARRILRAYGDFATTRIAIGYTMASALVFGALIGYISASEQIFIDTFALGEFFPLAFAAVAVSLAAATLINARLVNRFGMRRMTHSALLFFVIANLLHLAIAGTMGDVLPVFLLFTGASFFALGFIGPNCTSLALQPMGHIAGAAAAANGFAGTTLAGFLGGAVASRYDGTTMPIIMGFALLGLAALAFAIWTEKGRLFGVGESEAEQQ